MSLHIFRLPTLKARYGTPRSTVYHRISQGLWTKPVRLGARSVGWPDYECDAIASARIAGQSDDQIRSLVTQLEADRKHCLNPVAGQLAAASASVKGGSQ